MTDLEYAQRLATTLWRKHWQQDAPQWKPADTLKGVIDQIDNMTAGCELERTRFRAEAVAASG